MDGFAISSARLGSDLVLFLIATWLSDVALGKSHVHLL